MAHPQYVPGKTELKVYLSRGMTQQQIADTWGEVTGIKPSRSAIGLAIARYGLKSATPRPRYDDLLPWRVRTEHKMHYDARMLRLEGQSRAGKKLTADSARDLASWKRQLEELDAVVHYDGDTEEGFHLVRRDPALDEPGSLIRKPH